MSDNYKLAGAHLINRFVWSQIKTLQNGTNDVFTDYKDVNPNGTLNFIPIFPAQQQPEVIDMVGAAPFLVYNYTTGAYGEEWWRCQEQMAYMIYDDNEDNLRIIQNFLVDLLKRHDWSAAQVNNYLWGLSGNPYINWEFKYIRVTTATSPDNYTQVGGRQGAMVTIQYEYVHDLQGAEGQGMRV